MKKQILNYIIIATFICLTACEEDLTYPIENQCGYPGVDVHRNYEYDQLFSAELHQLTAGDISGSIFLNDSSIIWFVNDAMINVVGGAKHLNNCILLQTPDKVEVKHGGTMDNPQSLFAEPDANSWYSINNGIFYNNNFELLISSFRKTGAGDYDFEHTGVKKVVLNKEFKLLQEQTLSLNSDIRWGASILQDADYTYIYGSQTRDKGYQRASLIARIPGGSLLQKWEYYDNYAWREDMIEARPLLTDVSEHYSVFKEAGRYYLVTQPPLFGEEVKLYDSDTPEAKWRFLKILYCKSETKDTTLASNTIIHQVLNDGSLLGSYNLLNADFKTAGIYPAQFIKISNWK